jgi:hypothetical protein
MGESTLAVVEGDVQGVVGPVEKAGPTGADRAGDVQGGDAGLLGPGDTAGDGGGLGTGPSADGEADASGRDAAACPMQRSTSVAAGGAAGASRSSRRAPRPVPAPWLGSNTGEYATSSNWPRLTGEVFVGGGTEGDDVISEKGNTFSSKTTSRDM